MLTRTQVAQRLGKSVSTIRRLEGSALHPWRDKLGIHRFDPAEVERLVVRGPARVSRSNWFEDNVTLDDNYSEASRELPGPDREQQQAVEDELRKRLLIAEEWIAQAELDSEQSTASEHSREAELESALGGLRSDVCAFVESLSPRQAKVVGLERLERLLDSVPIGST